MEIEGHVDDAHIAPAMAFISASRLLTGFAVGVVDRAELDVGGRLGLLGRRDR